MLTVLKAALLAIAFAFCTLGVVLFLALEHRPRVDDGSAPTAQDVDAGRAFVSAAKLALMAADAPAIVRTSEAQLNSLATLTAHLVKGARARVVIDEGEIRGAASVPLPYTNEALWLNASATAPAFDGTFAFSGIRVGRVSLPPDLVLTAIRTAANRLSDGTLGDTIVDSAARLAIDGKAAEIGLRLGEVGSSGLMRSVFLVLGGRAPPDPALIERFYRMIREAMATGELPTEGSYLPYVRFVLEAAQSQARSEGAQNAYAAAIIALARVCGARDFTLIVGGVAGGEFDGQQTLDETCEAVTLNGRIDSRRHFTTAAAVQAVSARGFAVSIGEFKELYDTVHSGGFDFTDIAANNSGIRLSQLVLATPAAGWPSILARIKTERDVIVRFDGIPPIMPGEEFRTRFGTIDSARYEAQLAALEARIDALPPHRREGPN